MGNEPRGGARPQHPIDALRRFGVGAVDDDAVLEAIAFGGDAARSRELVRDIRVEIDMGHERRLLARIAIGTVTLARASREIR
jgi:hypothetical protein